MLGFERRWALACLEGFAPPEGPGVVARAGEVDFLATLEAMRASGTLLAALGLRLAVWLVAWTPLWLQGRPRTLASLPAAERAPLLGRLLVHRRFAVRELSFLLKVVAGMALMGAPEVRTRTAYDALPAALEVGR